MIIGENISIMRWTGIFVIFSGVVIIGFSKWLEENKWEWLLWLDPNDSESVYQVAQLHKVLLTDSPIPLLGDLFMTDSTIISADLINCLIYKH
jgi:drug/metabolite transporter (DMT)-like permease